MHATTLLLAAASTFGLSSAATTYKASFTQYGSGDTFGSGNCNTASTACGFYTSPGYSAAVSQNEFGVGPGQGAGPACGTCWKLTAETDSSGNKLSNAGNSIVVQVTNLCPASGNPLCSQNGLGGTNQYGANLNFDLCINSGANKALFGNSGVGLAVGNAVQVSCSVSCVRFVVVGELLIFGTAMVWYRYPLDGSRGRRDWLYDDMTALVKLVDVDSHALLERRKVVYDTQNEFTLSQKD